MSATVSIITRTRNRTPFLYRSLENLRQAAIDGSEWIVVDDEPGGSNAVAELVQSASESWDVPIRLVVSGTCHRAKAANAGLAEATGSFVHFLDDDDWISPDFYQKTTSFLSEQTRFAAVATLSERVVEAVTPEGRFNEVSREAHYPETRTVSLAELAVTQLFPPVAFVARREAVETIGGFDPSFEVCEDYEFFLRFLAHWDIGVLPEVLCAFHSRAATQDSLPESWKNSAVSQDHRLEDKLFRNALLRRDLARKEVGLGWLVALGDMTRANWRMNLVIDAIKHRAAPRYLMRWLRNS